MRLSGINVEAHDYVDSIEFKKVVALGNYVIDFITEGIWKDLQKFDIYPFVCYSVARYISEHYYMGVKDVFAAITTYDFEEIKKKHKCIYDYVNDYRVIDSVNLKKSFSWMDENVYIRGRITYELVSLGLVNDEDVVADNDRIVYRALQCCLIEVRQCLEHYFMELKIQMI